MGLLFSVLVSLVQLIQLIQQNGGIELAIVVSAQSLHCLVDGILVFVFEQVRDFSSPIHGLDRDLDRLGFVGRDNVVHRPNVTSGLDPDGVTRLNLHRGDIVGRRAHLVGADRSDGVDGPSVLGEFENFFPCFCDLQSAVGLD